MRQKISFVFSRILLFLKKNWFIFFVIFIYSFFAVYYVGFSQSISECNNTLNGLGDNTAGPIWRAANAGDSPIGGVSNMTNYPNGDNLSSPVDAVVGAQLLLLWLTAKLAGPVCGYNLANILGYISASLLMFGFIYSLTKGKRWIALLAGYAVAFTPFFQLKTEGHPSYGFQALLIGALWSLLLLLNDYKKSRVFISALLMAVCFYFDPYFSLLAITIAAPLILAWLIIGLIKYKNIFMDGLKSIVLGMGLLTVFISPLIYISITQSSQINSAVAGTRDNVIETARVFSNLPSEYFLPFTDSPIFKLFGDYGKKMHDSLYVFSMGNAVEDAVGIGLIMIFLIFLFYIVIAWEKLQYKNLNMEKLFRFDVRLLIFGVSAVAISAIILALPPIYILGIPLPSLVLLQFTNIWRVISREYVVVNIAVTTLFAIALVYFNDRLNISKIIKSVLFILFFICLFVQYQTYGPFQGIEPAKFSYNDAPEAYYWLNNQDDVKAIAEYPIEKSVESYANGYYLSMQIIHKKPMLNSVLSNSPDDLIRSSIKNLSDPQTIPVLHSLGINYIVVHGVKLEDVNKIPYLEVKYSGLHGVVGAPSSRLIANDILVIAKILDNAPHTLTSLQFLDNLSSDKNTQGSAVDWKYNIKTNSRFLISRLPSSDVPIDLIKSEYVNSCFDIKMFDNKDSSLVNLSANGQTLMVINADDQYKRIKLDYRLNEVVNISSSSGDDMVISSIGC